MAWTMLGVVSGSVSSMSEVDKRFEKQAEWQQGLRALPWPEKVRMAERVRESLVRWNDTSGSKATPGKAKPRPA